MQVARQPALPVGPGRLAVADEPLPAPALRQLGSVGTVALDYAGRFFRDARTSAFDAYRSVFDRDVDFWDLPTAFARMVAGDRPRKPLVRYG